MDKFFRFRIFRFLICLLLVAVFVINCSPIRAKALAAEIALVALPLVVTAALIGLGLSAEAGNNTAFDNIVSDCSEYLETSALAGLEIVSSASGAMVGLRNPSQDSYYVPKLFLETVVSWLFASNKISVNTPVTTDFYEPFNQCTISCTSSSPVYHIAYYYYAGYYYFISALVSFNPISVDWSDGSHQSDGSIVRKTSDGSRFFEYILKDTSSNSSSYLDSFSSKLSCPVYYISSNRYDYLYNYLSNAGSPSYPEGIAVSEVVPQVGEDIEITYIDWKELEKQLNEVGTSGEDPEDPTDPSTPIPVVPYWPIWSPQFTNPDATLDNVTQQDVWNNGSDPSWDPSNPGGSGSDSGGSDSGGTATSDLNDFTVDLTDVFPFCIPFDIYDFVCCLNAAPVTPVFEWGVPLPDGSIYSIEIDLSAFDSIASLLRKLQLLLFCIGLAFKTRDLIKG